MDNVVNATTNAESTDTESINVDNIDNAEIKNDKSEDIAVSDDNNNSPGMSDKDSPHAASGDDNAENEEPGENITEDVPSPLIYGRKMTDPTKVKTSKRHRPVKVKPLESPTGNPPVDKMPQVKRKVMHLILMMCEYMNVLFKVHQTLKI